MSSKGHSWCLLCACARVSVYICVPSSLLSLVSLSLFSLSLAVSLSLSLPLSLILTFAHSLSRSRSLSSLPRDLSFSRSSLCSASLSIALPLARVRAFALTWVLLQGLQKPSRVVPRIFEVKNPTADDRTYLPHLPRTQKIKGGSSKKTKKVIQPPRIAHIQKKPLEKWEGIPPQKKYPWYWPFLNSPRYSSPNCSMCTPCPSRSPCVCMGVAVSGWNGWSLLAVTAVSDSADIGHTETISD
jgi:hypothetical protein